MRTKLQYLQLLKTMSGIHDGLWKRVVDAEQARCSSNFPSNDEKHAISETEQEFHDDTGLKMREECGKYLVTPLTKQAPKDATGGNQGGTLESFKSCFDSRALMRDARSLASDSTLLYT